MQKKAREKKHRLSGNIKHLIFLPVFMLSLLAIAMLIGSEIFVKTEKTVVVYDENDVYIINTKKDTLGDALVQNDISLSPEDRLSLPEDTVLNVSAPNKVFIKRAVPVSLVVGGEIKRVYTSRDTVAEVLEDNSVELGTKDRLEGAKLDSPIDKNMVIKLIRVSQQYVYEENAIPFRVEERLNHQMDAGTSKTVREGIEGLTRSQIRLILENNKVISRNLISKSVIREPINKLVEIGTILNFINSRGDTVRYERSIDMKATSYTASFADCGKNPDHPEFGITYTGMKVRLGVIAVDPKVIPLGTKVYVEVLGNIPDYGYAIAADTGSAIKGNLIDLYFDDAEYVAKWGIKKVRVYVLKDQSADVFALRNNK